jgi:hypothetical protein
MQEGSVIREQRKLGPDVWCYRWWESGPTGNRVHRRIVFGTAEELRDMSTARQMTTGLMREINASDIRLAGTFMTLAQLADHFQQRELGAPGFEDHVVCSDRFGKFSTIDSLTPYRNWVLIRF